MIWKLPYHGKGRFYKDNDIIETIWHKGNINESVYVYNNKLNKLKYIGELDDNFNFHGYGEYYNYFCEKLHVGKWKNGKPYGIHKVYSNENVIYEGEIHVNVSNKIVYHGKGNLYKNKGVLQYKGRILRS